MMIEKLLTNSGNGLLTKIVERVKIFSNQGDIYYEEADESRHPLSPDAQVSMNLFGFMPDIFDQMDAQFEDYIRENINSAKAEFFIPYVADHLIKSGKGSFSVLGTPESWFGVTYPDDKPSVVQEIKNLVQAGEYPENLWA